MTDSQAAAYLMRCAWDTEHIEGDLGRVLAVAILSFPAGDPRYEAVRASVVGIARALDVPFLAD